LNEPRRTAELLTDRDFPDFSGTPYVGASHGFHHSIGLSQSFTDLIKIIILQVSQIKGEVFEEAKKLSSNPHFLLLFLSWKAVTCELIYFSLWVPFGAYNSKVQTEAQRSLHRGTTRAHCPVATAFNMFGLCGAKLIDY